MSTTLQSAPAAADDWTSLRGPCSGLTGLTARIRLQVDGHDAGILVVANGAAEIVPDGEATATANFDTLPILLDLLSGGMHPVVARLQNLVTVAGDIALIVRVFLGLQADSPWIALRPGA